MFEWIDQCNVDAKRIRRLPIVIFRLNRGNIHLVIPFKYQDLSLTSYIKNQNNRIIFIKDKTYYNVITYDNFDLNALYLTLKGE